MIGTVCEVMTHRKDRDVWTLAVLLAVTLTVTLQRNSYVGGHSVGLCGHEQR